MDKIICAHASEQCFNLLASLKDFSIPFVVGKHLRFFNKNVFLSGDPSAGILLKRGNRIEYLGYRYYSDIKSYACIEYYKNNVKDGFAIKVSDDKIISMDNYVNGELEGFSAERNILYSVQLEYKNRFKDCFDYGYYKKGERDGIWSVWTVGCPHSMITEYKDGVEDKELRHARYFYRHLRK